MSESIPESPTGLTAEAQAYLNLPGFDIIANKINDTPFALEPAPAMRSWMTETKGHAAKCLPLLVGNQMGWIIRNPCDATAIWNGGARHADTHVLLDDRRLAKTITSHFGHGIVTWQIPWLFRTTEGIGLMVRGCSNFWVDNARALDAFVETNWSPYTFTFNWKIMKPDVPVTWKKGDPVCMIIPYPINFIEKAQPKMEDIRDNEALNTSYLEWSKYRDAFNSSDHKNDWQKDYFKGLHYHPDENKRQAAKYHKTKFSLPPFKDVDLD